MYTSPSQIIPVRKYLFSIQAAFRSVKRKQYY